MQPSPRYEMIDFEEEEDWIVPYADMVTLLLCFFILFFNQNIEVTRLNLLKDLRADLMDNEEQGPGNLNEDFRRPGSTEQTLGGTANRALYGQSSGNAEASVSEADKRKRARAFNLMESDLRASVESLDLQAVKVKYERKPHKLIVRIWEQGIFGKGDWQISAPGYRMIEKIRSRIKPYEKDVRVQVVGHSDSSPVSKNSPLYNNINLSGLRALSASNILLEGREGLSPNSVQALGLGASQPLVQDRTPAGEVIPEKADLNRRIELWLTQTPGEEL